MSLDRLLADKRLVVCCGSGGVGKTTTAAAVALRAAAQGRRTLVITIDPARRLAQSLGLEGLDNEERRVPPERLAAAGMGHGGELFAAMLDTQASLDALIRKVARDEDQARRILANRIYRQLSNAIAGSQEYVAMERLFVLMQERDYDLVVLDTPPTKNALDFLNAPNRLASFLDEGVVKWFLAPPKGGVGSALFQKGGGVVFRLLGMLVSESFVRDLFDFFQAFAGLYAGFRERAQRVNELLRDPGTIFLLVTSPERHALAEAVHFHDRLLEAGIPLQAVIVNRAFEPLDGALPDPVELRRLLEAEALRPEAGVPPRLQGAAPGLSGKLADLVALAQQVNGLARENVERIRQTLHAARQVALVPAFADDIHDLRGLSRMNRYLFAS